MSTLLLIETSTTNTSVGISKDGELIGIKEKNSKDYSHSELIHQYIHELSEELQLPMSAINGVAVGKGPGSYTGLRIGVSTAKGLCYALEIPLVAINTLEILAQEGNAENYDFIIPLLDARRQEAYTCILEKGKKITPTYTEILDENSFQEQLNKGSVLFVGNKADEFKNRCTHPQASFKTAYPSVRGMAKIAHRRYKNNNFEDVAYFEPFYLKDFIIQNKKNR